MDPKRKRSDYLSSNYARNLVTAKLVSDTTLNREVTIRLSSL